MDTLLLHELFKNKFKDSPYFYEWNSCMFVYGDYEKDENGISHGDMIHHLYKYGEEIDKGADIFVYDESTWKIRELHGCEMRLKFGGNVICQGRDVNFHSLQCYTWKDWEEYDHLIIDGKEFCKGMHLKINHKDYYQY